jgi:DNA polymerase (family 10)
MQDAATVANGLREIAGLLRFAGQPRFKVKAYERAAQIVETVDPELAGLVEQRRLRDLQGIGLALAEQIRQLWNSGSSDLLDRLRSENPPGAAELVRVPGLTPKRIRALSDALGVDSVQTLLQACVEHRVRDVRGFGAKTEQSLLDACERWLSRSAAIDPPPILLSDGLELLESLRRALAGSSPLSSIAGALRRGQETAEELDLVVMGDRAEVLETVARPRQVLRVDREKAIAHVADGVKIRLHAATATNWGSKLFAATGSDAHVAAIQQRAEARGIDLAQHSFANEAELYAAVGLLWVPPEQRQGADELVRAEGRGFDDLVELAQIHGLVHCHTTYSDGKNSVLEMARAAEGMGMGYITITDHSPSAHYAGGVSLDALKAQWDEISAAQEQTSVRILRGTESDILRDGDLDYPDAILEQFEVVIASIHARHRLDRAEMTARLVRAMSLPFFKIWGHGLGRILNHRPPIDCDVPAVLDALANAGGAIELNADPYRLDLPPAWLPAARARNLPFVISVDAHSTRGFDVLRYGITMARRGGVEAREVLNALPADAFAAAVRPFNQHGIKARTEVP